MVLPAPERLVRDSLFQRAYAGRKSISSSLLTLYVLPRQPESRTRLPLVGFVVGKKVHNKAVYRNRAKRQVREAYKKHRLTDTRLTQWYAMVWVVHKGILDASWEDICSTVADLSDRASKKYGRGTLSGNSYRQGQSKKELLNKETNLRTEQ
ncbi:MAG: ribonuclease P protein component [Candidatus Melainabacteria bacterium]|nr:ribonuclease P protein component [Candidatus Melainabacteria bacterium]